MSADSKNVNLRVIKNIRDLEITGKKLFLRLDLNVPLSGPDEAGTRHVEDDSRITEALPTIRYAIEKGAKIILASHLGRPKGKKNLDYSLEPVAQYLAHLLNQEVTLADDCVGEGIELMAQGLKNSQIMMLENLRFHAEEETNDQSFSHKLASLCEVYVTDAFGTAHRKHASTYGLPILAPNKGMGFLIEKELKFLDPLLNQPVKPYFAILGGSKVSDKIKTIEVLLRDLNGLLIGGAMAYAFMEAKGLGLPKNAKKPASEDIQAAKLILDSAKRKDLPVLLPIDTLDSFDIGPKTIEIFNEFLTPAKTIFWNGPLGWFEKEEYSKGTFAIAKHLSEMKCLKVVGGGDTVAAIKQSGFSESFDHLSTGGGAVLEYLEGYSLPGIEVLKGISTR